MNLTGLGFVALFAGLIIAFIFLGQRKGAKPAQFRPLEALQSLPQTVGDAVETGRRLHISLGSGSVGQTDTAAALAGLTVLDQISEVTVVSDKPPIVTTGDGTVMLLAQDTLQHVYARQNAQDRYDPTSARVAGLSPISFGAATSVMVKDESLAGTVLVGSVGPEVVLLTEASQRAGVTTLAGSDDPAAQAVLFAAAEAPLIGEDLFAGGAYIGRHPGHVASLRAQDIMRLLIGVVIIGGVLLKTVGILK
jgi:hypothetical protein